MALRRDSIERRLPACSECQFQDEWGCAPGTKAKEPLEFTFGGKGYTNTLTFDRCPLAILRGAAPDVEAWTDYAIRQSMVADHGGVNFLGLSAFEREIIQTASAVRAQVTNEAQAEAMEG